MKTASNIARKTILIASIILLSLLITKPQASAHNSGYSFEHVAGEYTIDVGTDTENPLVNDSTKLDFALVSSKDKTNASYDKVWVKITQGQKVYLATGLAKAKIGPTTLVYDFPKEGNYDLYVRYEKDDLNAAQHTFNLTVVTDPDSKKPLHPVIPIAIASILSLGIGLLVANLRLFKKPRK